MQGTAHAKALRQEEASIFEGQKTARAAGAEWARERVLGGGVGELGHQAG